MNINKHGQTKMQAQWRQFSGRQSCKHQDGCKDQDVGRQSWGVTVLRRPNLWPSPGMQWPAWYCRHAYVDKRVMIYLGSLSSWLHDYPMTSAALVAAHKRTKTLTATEQQQLPAPSQLRQQERVGASGPAKLVKATCAWNEVVMERRMHLDWSLEELADTSHPRVTY